MAADLGEKDLEKAKFAFSVYDMTGANSIDAFYVGDCLRALALNPTQALVEKLGGAKKKGEKTLTVEEFLPIYAQAKKDKDVGVYEDFIECLKLYDKQEDGLLLAAEIQHILLSLGEKLSEPELDEIIKDCMDPEDDDGMIPYVPFLARVCGVPIPKEINPHKW